MIYDHIYGPFPDKNTAMIFFVDNDINYRGVPAVGVDDNGNRFWGTATPVELITKEAVYAKVKPGAFAAKLLSPRKTKSGFFVRMPSDDPATKFKPLYEVVKRGETKKSGVKMSVVAA